MAGNASEPCYKPEMALVDLRDRLDEPAVLALLGDTRPDNDEILAGWEENGRLVAAPAWCGETPTSSRCAGSS